MELINQIQNELINKTKSLLVDFLSFGENKQFGSQNQSLLKDLLLQLDDLFLIVIVGEYNSGKSAFINALLGSDVVAAGVTPTTSEITLLRYGPEKRNRQISPGQQLIELPNPILKEISLVDTPGTNAILREHESLTTEFVPRSDLILFITSVDRPFSESERIFLELIKQWGKKVVIIINKSDIAGSENDLEEINRFVEKNARQLLGISPPIFSISGKNALAYKLENDLTPDAKFQELENYIFKALNPSTQLAIKLSSPLGVLAKLIKEQTEIIKEKKDLLGNDIQLLTDLESQLVLFRYDMLHSFKFHYAEIDNSLLEFEKRGLIFFENTYRIARIMDLINKERIQSEYNKQVLRGLSEEINDKVNGLIDWIVEEDLKQWQTISKKIDQRIINYQDRVFDDPETRQIRFERSKIIEAVKKESQKIVDQFDRDDEARKIAEDAQMAIAASAAVEVGALGLGALITILATTASADLTGILLAGLTAALGFLILPAKKKQVMSLFSKKIDKLRSDLSKSLLAEFTRQIDTIIEKVNATIQPYSRFVRSEEIALKKTSEELSTFSGRVSNLREELSKPQNN